MEYNAVDFFLLLNTAHDAHESARMQGERCYVNGAGALVVGRERDGEAVEEKVAGSERTETRRWILMETVALCLIVSLLPFAFRTRLCAALQRLLIKRTLPKLTKRQATIGCTI